jgi:hypothetical protein
MQRRKLRLTSALHGSSLALFPRPPMAYRLYPSLAPSSNPRLRSIPPALLCDQFNFVKQSILYPNMFEYNLAYVYLKRCARYIYLDRIPFICLQQTTVPSTPEPCHRMILFVEDRLKRLAMSLFECASRPKSMVKLCMVSERPLFLIAATPNAGRTTSTVLGRCHPHRLNDMAA